MPPNRSTAAAATAAQAARLATSAIIVATSPPDDARSFAAADSAASSRPVITTRAPRARNCRAIPFPIPLLPPVTITDRPCSESIFRASCAVMQPNPAALGKVRGWRPAGQYAEL